MLNTTTAKPSNILAFQQVQPSSQPRSVIAKRQSDGPRSFVADPPRPLDVDTAIWLNNQRRATGFFRSWR